MLLFQSDLTQLFLCWNSTCTEKLCAPLLLKRNVNESSNEFTVKAFPGH